MTTMLHPEPQAQEEMPFAIVQGEDISIVPKDLFIPPDALEVILEAFEGPLDLLLYLIKRQNLNILDIPIAEITHQYMDYIALMETLKFELAAEYLVMAAMLAEIKSRMLLPRIQESDEEEDPRAELIRRLQEYERFKKVATELDQLPRMEREFDIAQAWVEMPKAEKRYPDVDIKELILAFEDVVKRSAMFKHHQVEKEQLSVRERMSIILSKLTSSEFVEFSTLFEPEEGKAGAVVSFLAILELIKGSLIELVQNMPYSKIYVRPKGAEDAG